MTGNMQHSNESFDELDFMELMKKWVAFLMTYAKYLISFTVIGVVAGAISYKTQPRYFSSEILLKSIVLSGDEQLKIINGWNKLIGKGEFGILAARLGMSDQSVAGVISISSTLLPNAKARTINDVSPVETLEIQALVKDASLLDSLQKGIIYGLQNSEYVRSRVELKQADWRILIEIAETELKKLDSMAISRPGSGASVSLTRINMDIMELNEKLLFYKESLEWENGVYLLKGFDKVTHPETSGMSKKLLIGLIGGFIAGLVISFVISIWPRILK